ncbi:Competence protein ComM [Corynebacterium kalinowskii]|uniref:Competence protein ComM n=1 Tax=Corynebacterium kalinowskii TaxID=2675216 RepID=A0A6B8VDN3_9CORY|nr:YifB family Mg chelatase-like AAA ATPase [Corynebacterium kalinowskii]QGU02293.1 Competence protein ComM [Corynebacterium kalinowskii]
MALAKTLCVSFEGVSALIVGVEANIGAGLPGMYVVGLAGAAMSEAKDRLKTAMINAGLPWPKTKLIVNLSTADLRKSGSHFDLAICAAVMSATLNVRTDDTMFLGEVGLDGAIKPVPGILPALLAARDHGVQCIVVPAGNEAEAGALAGITVLTASHITEVADWLQGHGPLDRAVGYQRTAERHPDMADVVGQEEAKIAAEVAAAGGHHLLLIGPPGSGKSMIAARIPGILPELTDNEAIESSAVHSMSGSGLDGLLRSAPLVTPHHSVSSAALIGGGSGRPKPGAVSLAHHGVLFLDEINEIPAHVLDSLRMPLESGVVRLLRGQREVMFPAQFQLVMAANPCRCGCEEPADCTCPATVRRRYLSNLSGPLKDRIDLCVRTHVQGAQILGDAESSAAIAARVVAARERALHRWGVLSGRMDSRTLRRDFAADEAGMAYLGALLADGELSQRGVDRTLRVAWTLSDLAQQPKPGLEQIAAATALHNTNVTVPV